MTDAAPDFNEVKLAPRVIYEKPPVFERVLSAFVATPIEEERFQILSEKWKESICLTFPFYRPQVLWDLNIVERDGRPQFSESEAQMELKNWYWRNPGKKLSGFGTQSHPSRMSLNLLKENENAHSFEELFGEFQVLLPQWSEVFGVKEFKGVSIEYVNSINHQTMPSHVSEDGSYKTGEILHIFRDLKLPSLGLVTPLKNEFNFLMRRDPAIRGRVKINSDENRGISVDILVQSLGVGRIVDLKVVLKEAEELHDYLLTIFDTIFTDEAKQAFIPKS